MPRNGCYFFLAGALAEMPFGVTVDDTPTAGASTFLGCLGFLASRLPRVELFVMMPLLICLTRKRRPISQSGRFWSLCRDLYFKCLLVARIAQRAFGKKTA